MKYQLSSATKLCGVLCALMALVSLQSYIAPEYPKAFWDDRAAQQNDTSWNTRKETFHTKAEKIWKMLDLSIASDQGNAEAKANMEELKKEWAAQGSAHAGLGLAAVQARSYYDQFITQGQSSDLARKAAVEKAASLN